MISFLKNYILGGSVKNPTAPFVLLILLIFIAATTTYYVLLFPAEYLLFRLPMSIAKVLAYIALERSRLSNDTLSYLAPTVILAFLIAATIYFGGDYLIFSYTLGGAMISLTYMKPKGIAIYIGIITAAQILLMLLFNQNLMGANFTMAQNYGGLVTSVALSIMVYIYAKIYHARNMFVSNMSHEIRTPITAVLGISEIRLQSRDIPPETEESFVRIHNSAKMLLGLINDILDFSKLEDGKMQVLEEEYELATLISSFAHPHYDQLKDKNIAFNLRVDEDLPTILAGDVLRIEQIMVNLLSNAFKYTDEGWVDLTIKNSTRTNDTVTLIFTIRDTGIGMTRDQLKTIYDAYTRFHEKTKKTTIGTGLGMSIVYKIVKLMNGQIEMKSEVGKGTTVTVHIPQKIINNAPLGADTIARLQNFETQSGQSGFKFTPEPMPYGKVLLVDDIEANLFVAKGLLAFYHLNVETCQSGAEALTKIKQGEHYDLILMDSMMPKLNGTETMKMIRDMGYTQPIVVLTANALVGLKEEYIRDGFDDYLSKPIITKNLNDILMKHIRDKYPPSIREEAILSITTAQQGQDIDSFQSNAALIEQLRQDFAKNQKNTFFDISQAQKKGDIETAHRLAHTIKGLAALIQEHDLSKAAARVEEQLEAKKLPTPEDLQILEQEMAKVLNNIVLLPITRTRTAPQLFQKLKPMLEHRKAESMDLLPELRKIPETAIIARQIEKMDFGGALKSLNILMDIIENG